MAPPLPIQHDRTVVEHNPGFITLYSDGSFERPTDLDVPACPRFVEGVASKDVVLNSSTGVWARFFLPQVVAGEEREEEERRTNVKVPVVLHFHGGGFCTGSPATRVFHDFCSRMAVASRCIWISVGYRLAPENFLPAAYDDACAALLWLRSQASAAEGGNLSDTESWLAEHADFSKCFLAGESAGGTIVHFSAVRGAANDWSPVKIRGLLVIHAAFTQAKPKEDLPHPVEEFYHRSMLPGGAPVDHPFLNPLHSDWPKFSEIELPPLFVAVAEEDILRRGSEEYYEALKKAGKDAQFFESERVGHCFHLDAVGSADAELLEGKMIEFIHKLAKM